MIQIGVVDSVVSRIAPEALLSVLEMRHNAVPLPSVAAARGGGKEARLAADEQVAGGWVAGAELAGAVEQPRVGPLSVSLAAVDGGAAAEARSKYKQSAESHGAVGPPAPLTALAGCGGSSARHSRAAPPLTPRPTAPDLHAQGRLHYRL